MMNSEGKTVPESLSLEHCSIADRWIMSRFENAAKAIEESMQHYRFDLASQTLHEFIWNEYCDWYVELSKPVLWDEEANSEAAQATRWVLLSILEQSLRLLHPFMPFITEEVWQKVAPLLGKNGDSIMIETYPLFDQSKLDSEAEEHIEWIKGVVVAIRNIRGEMDVPPAKSIKVMLRNGASADQGKLEEYRPYLQKLAKLESIEWLTPDDEVPAAATGLYQELEILVPLAGIIDVEAERARLSKEIAKLEGALKSVTSKLSNAKFVDNAPDAVVAKEREKQEQITQALQSLQAKRDQLKAL